MLLFRISHGGFDCKLCPWYQSILRHCWPKLIETCCPDVEKLFKPNLCLPTLKKEFLVTQEEPICLDGEWSLT